MIIVITGDLHTNSTVGLTPPGVIGDDGQQIDISDHQRWLFDKWVEFWKNIHELGDNVIHVVNGDLCDVNKHSKFQLHTVNPAVVVDLSEVILSLAEADRTVIVRGTEAHTGGAAHIETLVARRIDAASALYAFKATIGPLRLMAVHHPPSNSRRPWTVGGGANRTAAMLESYFYNKAWRPNLAVFSHVHHNEDSYDNHKVRVVFNRPWTLHNAFDWRTGVALAPTEIGALVISVNQRSFKLTKYVETFDPAEPEVIQLSD